MSVSKPSIEELRVAAGAFRLSLTDVDLASFQALADQALVSQRRLEELGEPPRPIRYPRTLGHRPERDENRFNAWAWKCAIKGASTGPLAGHRIAVKDNVCVAGIPMRNGSAVLEGFVPDIDATVITRILDAGGEIVGKAACENLSFSGGSHTCSPAPVVNPHVAGYSSGGSSSGSAVLVASGEVDMAIGGDQGGSVRIPSAWCGIVGLKPTHGLVPYTGIFPIDLTLDHVGPMAARVCDVALLLESIAGSDGLDPRQKEVRTGAYVKALHGGVKGLRIALVEEGFGWAGASQRDVDELVEAASRTLVSQGAQVTRISIPLHRDGIHIHSAIIVEGATAILMAGNGVGTNWKGYHDTGLLDAFARGRRARADQLPETVKLVVLLGHYLQERHHGRYYAMAQNLAGRLRSAYDAALAQVDLLVMPTTPMKASRLPAPEASREEVIARAHEMNLNTCPFDVTGHPAMSVPCGMSDGLPVGVMLVGRHWDEPTVLRVGNALEASTR
jgi:amidase